MRAGEGWQYSTEALISAQRGQLFLLTRRRLLIKMATNIAANALGHLSFGEPGGSPRINNRRVSDTDPSSLARGYNPVFRSRP